MTGVDLRDVVSIKVVEDVEDPDRRHQSHVKLPDNAAAGSKPFLRRRFLRGLFSHDLSFLSVLQGVFAVLSRHVGH